MVHDLFIFGEGVFVNNVEKDAAGHLGTWEGFEFWRESNHHRPLVLLCLHRFCEARTFALVGPDCHYADFAMCSISALYSTGASVMDGGACTVLSKTKSLAPQGFDPWTFGL